MERYQPIKLFSPSAWLRPQGNYSPNIEPGTEKAQFKSNLRALSVIHEHTQHSPICPPSAETNIKQLLDRQSQDPQMGKNKEVKLPILGV
ncbi:hypothetical protein PVK06_028677 [Gossypium arboreum]|uniref:Uncharacterized protein n=1 Tax=Gossypium arboreum TaxID=29729 RepID=A0ABR0P3K8_GOSAR|nr:hypothetical protein PVK06_028677 [Gossypium arboreum]